MPAAGFKILDAYVEVHADASKVTREAEDQIRSGGSALSRAGSGLGSSLMSGMQGVIGGLIGGVTAAITTPLVNGVNAAIGQVIDTVKYATFDYNTLLENANIGFTTMLGSGQKAKAFLDDLQTFAASTPFEFSDLTLASQRLIAMGIHAKDVIPTMTAIGDAVAGLGGDAGTIDQLVNAIGQMTAKGKIQGDEILQLTEAGVPALKILASEYGVTTSEIQTMITKGQVLADRAVPAIIRGLEEGTKTTAGFGGMMAKQSKTMSGSLSNIQDSINQTLSKAFLPMFKVVERVAGALARFAGSQDVQRWAKDTAADVGKFLGQIEKAIKQVFDDPVVQAQIRELGKEISKAFAEIGPAVAKIIPNLVKFATDVMPYVVQGMSMVVRYVPVLLKWWGQLSTGLAAIGKPVAFVISTFNNLTSFLFTAAAAFKDAGIAMVQGLINGVTGMIPAAVDSVGKLAGAVASGFKGFLGIQSPSKVFHQYGKWIVEGLHKGLLGSVDQIKAAGEKIADAVDKPMKAGVEKVTKRLVALAKNRDAVIDKLKDAKDVLAGLRADRDSYRSNVRAGVLGEGNLLDAYTSGSATTSSASVGTLDGRTYTGSYTTTTTAPSGLAAVKARLKKMVLDTRQFTKNLKLLVKRGIYKDLFQQLVDAGPTAGLALTNELIADKGTFDEINSLGKKLATAGNLLGDFAAGVTYDGDISRAATKVNDLRDRRDAIVVNMIVEARKIDEVDKVVKMINAAKKTARSKKAVKK